MGRGCGGPARCGRSPGRAKPGRGGEAGAERAERAEAGAARPGWRSRGRWSRGRRSRGARAARRRFGGTYQRVPRQHLQQRDEVVPIAQILVQVVDVTLRLRERDGVTAGPGARGPPPCSRCTHGPKHSPVSPAPCPPSTHGSSPRAPRSSDRGGRGTALAHVETCCPHAGGLRPTAPQPGSNGAQTRCPHPGSHGGSDPLPPRRGVRPTSPHPGSHGGQAKRGGRCEKSRAGAAGQTYLCSPVLRGERDRETGGSGQAARGGGRGGQGDGTCPGSPSRR